MQRIRGYKYRAYPDRSQREFFAKNFGCCRFVYNHYLEKKQQLWKEWLKEADSAALQQSLRHLDNAYDNFFKKRGGYPKFKSKRSAQKYRTPNNKGSVRLDGDAVIIPKAGRVKIVKTRDFDGRIMSATVSKTPLRHEKRLKRLQRSLSRKQKGSANREKARRRLASAV